MWFVLVLFLGGRGIDLLFWTRPAAAAGVGIAGSYWSKQTLLEGYEGITIAYPTKHEVLVVGWGWEVAVHSHYGGWQKGKRAYNSLKSVRGGDDDEWVYRIGGVLDLCRFGGSVLSELHDNLLVEDTQGATCCADLGSPRAVPAAEGKRVGRGEGTGDGGGGVHLIRHPIGPSLSRRLIRKGLSHPFAAIGKQVAALSTYGLTVSEIAQYLKLPIAIVKVKYGGDIERGELEAHVSVARRILYDALNTRGSVGLDAAKFWMKNRAGWHDRFDVRGLVEVSNVSTDGDALYGQLEKLGRLIEFAASAGTVIPALTYEVDSSGRPAS